MKRKEQVGGGRVELWLRMQTDYGVRKGGLIRHDAKREGDRVEWGGGRRRTGAGVGVRSAGGVCCTIDRRECAVWEGCNAGAVQRERAETRKSKKNKQGVEARWCTKVGGKRRRDRRGETIKKGRSATAEKERWLNGEAPPPRISVGTGRLVRNEGE